jgi:hypothetical protein
MADRKHPFAGRISHLENVLGKLEGLAFGRWLEFSAMGYSDELRINIQGENGKINGFEHLPGIREFAKDLNAAMRPVIDAYTERLRQEIANECVKVASCALSSKEEK